MAVLIGQYLRDEREIHPDENAIAEAVEAGISAYVVDGLRKERIKPILDLCVSRFNAFAKLQEELERTKSQLEDRKVIEQFTGIGITITGTGPEGLRDFLDREIARWGEVIRSAKITVNATPTSATTSASANTARERVAVEIDRDGRLVLLTR